MATDQQKDDGVYLDALVSVRIRAEDRDRLLERMGTKRVSVAVRKVIEEALSTGIPDQQDTPG